MRRLLQMLLLVALMVPIGAKVHAQAVTLPLVQDFENGLGSWTTVDANYNTGVTSIFESGVTAHGGSSAFDFRYGYDWQYLISPEIDPSDSPVQLSFWYATAGTYVETFNVGYSTTTSDVSAFTWGPEISYTLTDWIEHVEFLPAGVKYIAIRYTAYDQWHLYVDDIYLGELPTCPFVSSPSVSGIDTAEATLAWIDTLNDDATYTVRYWAVGSTDTTTVTDISDTSITLTDLTPGTQYRWMVYAVCSSDDSSTATIGNTFGTECIPVGIPLEEDFETCDAGSSAEFVSCWTRGANSGNSYYPYVTNANGGKELCMYGYGEGFLYAITPQISEDVDLTELELSFDVRTSSWSGYAGALTVGMISGTSYSDGDNIDILGTYNVTSGSYTENIISLANYTGDKRHIIFLMNVEEYGESYIYLDNINLHLLPDCPRVNDLAFSGATSTSATFTWSCAASSFEYEFIHVGSTDDTVTDVVNDTTVTIEDLVFGDDYTIRVRAICDGEYGLWTNRVNCHIGYCEPSPEDVDGSGITNVTFGEGDEVVNNSQSPSNYYGNYTSQVGAVAAGNMANVAITYSTGYTYGTIVWVDWNNNFIFEGNEVVWVGESSSSNPATIYALFQIPSTCDTGRYVMRIAGADSQFDDYITNLTAAANANPCFSGSYATAHDYTLHVTEAPDCLMPEGLAFVVDDATSATFSWTSESGSFEYTLSSGDTTLVNDFTSDTSVTIDNLVVGNDYVFRVRAFCGGDSTAWFVSNFHWGYCTPNIDDTDGDGITNVTYGDQVVVNDNSSDEYYSDHTDMVGSAAYGTAMDMSITYSTGGYTYGTIVWVDWNRNYLFEGSEVVYYGTSTTSEPSTLNFTVDVPSTQDTGRYVMRVIGADSDLDYFVGSATAAAGADACFTTNWGVARDYTLQVTEPPTCPRPQNLTLDSISATTMAISWMHGGEESEWLVVLNDSITVNVTDTSAFIEELEPNTIYNVSVFAYCGGDDTSSAIRGSWRTLCVDPDIPYRESFENGSEACWTITSNYQYFEAGVDDYTATNGSHSMYFYSGNSGNSTYFVTPHLGDLSGLMISADVKGSYSYGRLQFGVMSDPNNISTFRSIGSVVSLTSEWGTYDAIVNDTTGCEYIAMKLYNTSSGYDINVDNVNIMLAPSCVKPVSVSVRNISTDEAEVVVNDTSEGMSYYLVVNSGEDSVYNNAITDTVFTVSNLTPATLYNVSVAGLCDDGTMTVAVGTTFYTQCEAIATLPWTENFEGWGTGNAGFHPCWAHFYQSGSSIYTTSYPYVNSGSAHSGSKYMYNYTYQGSSSQYYSVFYLPEFEADINTLGVSFFFHPNSTSYFSGPRVAVGVSDSATADTTTFTRLATIAPTQNAWEEFDADLSAYTGNGGRITFVVYGTTANYIYPYIDDITVDVLADCRRPSVVEAVNVIDTEATISWVDASMAGSYNVTLYDASGAAIGSTVTVTDTVYTFTGLTGTTTYTVGVSSNCSGTPTAERMFSFTTTCSPIASLPWTEDFESYTGGSYASSTYAFNDPCWAVHGRYSVSYPYVYTTYVHTGSNALNIYSYDGSSNPRTTMVLPVFATPADSLYISLWARSTSVNYGLEFGYMTDANNPASFVSTLAWRPAASNTWYEVFASFTGAPAGSRMALRYNGSNYGTVYIDDITVDLMNQCASSVEARVSRTTADSVVVEWTPGFGLFDGATVTIINETGTAVQTITDATSPQAIGGLASETAYQAVVSLICEGDIVAADTVDFTTRCLGGTDLEISAATLNLTPSANHYTPIGSYFNHSTSEQIYLASELGNQAMNITSISFSYTYATAMSGAFTGSIYLMATTDSMLTTSMPVPASTSDMQLVYNGPLDMVQGWNEFVFTTSFAYDGTSNLLVAVVADGAYVGDQDRFATHPVPSGRTAYYNNDYNNYSGSTSATLHAKRSDVKFGTCGGSTPQPTQYTVTLSSADATMGTVSPAGTMTVNEGTSFTATATPANNHVFTGWVDATGDTVSTANPYTFTVTADVTLTATFEANSTPTYYTVSVSSANTAMGTVSCTPSGSVEAGTSVTATATPANNHVFTGWVNAAGDTVSHANPYTFTVTADVTLVGTFRNDGVGIETVSLDNVNLYPNPASTSVTISGLEAKAMVTLVDINGHVSGQWTAKDNTLTIDLTNYATGTYFVRIVGEQVMAVRKLIIK